MREIKLTKNQIAIVDDDDFERVSQRSWHFRQGQAMRTTTKSAANGCRTIKVAMHREVLGLEEKDRVKVVHIDGNKLNNQKSNLSYRNL